MRLHMISIGRWSAGPEKALYDHYAERVDKSARNIGLSPLILEEVIPKKLGSRDAEGAALLNKVPQGSFVVSLDETGRQFSSEQFAQMIGRQRDDGMSDMVFLIGGADGHDDKVKRAGRLQLSLGPMTWPHLLVRGLLAEQIYRAATILAGHPYHRGRL